MQLIKEAGGEAILVHADVSDRAGAELMAQRAVDAYGSWTAPLTTREYRAGGSGAVPPTTPRRISTG